jgi:hypothetical protein
MSQKLISGLHILALLTISFCLLGLFGLFTIRLSAFRADFPFRKLIIGVVYITSCALGIFASFFPKQCSEVIYHNEVHERNIGINTYLPQHGHTVVENQSIVFRLKITHGHHPPCDFFFNHEFRLRNKTFCSGCFGLVSGALISLLGAIFYFFFEHTFWISRITIILGIFAVWLSFLLFHINLNSYLRIFPNFMLIIGAFVILIGMDYLFHSIIVDVLALLATYFWVITRIYLSQWTHLKICGFCGFKCVSVEA